MITVNDQPCWIAQTTPTPGMYDDEHHFVDEAAAREHADEREIERRENDEEPSGWVVTQQDQPCWIATCDQCEYAYDCDEYAEIHFDSRAAAERALKDDDWVITADGQVFCSTDCQQDHATAKAA